jgi:8-amino-7-oxononanoate synthase
LGARTADDGEQLMTTPAESLRQLAADGLLRQQRPLDSASGVKVIRDGRELWNFASNDYLGLAHHPQIEAALMEGVQRYGAGSAASRLVCGTLPPHRALETALADAKQTEAALTFSSGFATALGTIPAIVGKSDFVVLDKLCHASLVDGARLSGATIRVFPHNDLTKLERLLLTLRANHADSRILVVTESVFSMDGDGCPLRQIVELTETHEALLLLDEAHGFGVLGATGLGLAEQENLQSRIAFQMGTLSKAAGLAGGYLAASSEWIQLLVNRARSFIHAAIASLALIRSAEGAALRATLRHHLAQLSAGNAPIIPKILGTNEAALKAAQDLESAGFLVPAIRFPTVPRGTARLRISVSAAHPSEAVSQLAPALQR